MKGAVVRLRQSLCSIFECE